MLPLPDEIKRDKKIRDGALPDYLASRRIMPTAIVSGAARHALRVYSLAGLVKNTRGKGPADRRCVMFISKSGNQIRLLQWDTDDYDL